MTKKDYKLIARVFYEEVQSGRIQLPNIDFDVLVSGLCAALKQDNHLFDARKFLDACYRGKGI